MHAGLRIQACELRLEHAGLHTQVEHARCTPLQSSKLASDSDRVQSVCAHLVKPRVQLVEEDEDLVRHRCTAGKRTSHCKASAEDASARAAERERGDALTERPRQLSDAFITMERDG